MERWACHPALAFRRSFFNFSYVPGMRDRWLLSTGYFSWLGRFFQSVRLACIHNHPVALDDLMTAKSKVIAMVILG